MTIFSITNPTFKEVSKLFNSETKTYNFDKVKVFEFKSMRSSKLEFLGKKFHVSCNIVKDVLNAGQSSTIVKSVQIDNIDFQTVKSFDNLMYFPIDIAALKNIEINIVDEDNKPFPFQNGKTIVSLHFRKLSGTMICNLVPN
jgi:hypothetical protein